MLLAIKEKSASGNGSCLLSLETLEGVDLEVLDETVELVLGVFVFVLLSADSDTDLSWHVSDAIAPHKSVQAGVNANVLNTAILDNSHQEREAADVHL